MYVSRDMVCFVPYLSVMPRMVLGRNGHSITLNE